MKIIELLIDELDKLTGVDAVALVEQPAIEADFFAFKATDVEETIALSLIKLAFEEDIYELKIGDYQTRHYDMCPGASALYNRIESGEIDVDMGLAIRAAKLQDSLFWLEKHTIKEMGKATYDDVVAAQNLAYEIMQLAEMMGLTEEHQYIYGHIQAIRDLAEKTGFDVDVTGLPDFVDEIGDKKKDNRVFFESYTDYPESATNAAKKALEFKENNPDNDCGTRVGWARANQLAKREPISEETIARMASFKRHQQHKDVPYTEGCGGLMWDCWGGTAGIEWASNKLEEIREEQSSQKFNFALEEDQQMVVGPLMIPNKLILRVDEEGEPYYVFFSEETIKNVSEKVMREKYMDQLNIEHDSDKPVDGYMVSTWLIEDEIMDKQQVYGFSYPKGTWMGQYKIEDLSVWNKVKEGEVKGFSIEGFFSDRFVQAKAQ